VRKVILGLGVAVGIVAWAIGIYGLVVTPNPHVIPVPYRVISFGASAMMGTLLLLVIAFAHGSRAGDID
jgi:hypothetical protein